MRAPRSRRTRADSPKGSRRRDLGKLAIACLLLAARAGAEPPQEDPRSRSRVVPTAVAIVPGALVHGAGHFAAGDSETGRTLLLLEAAGLTAGVGGFVGLFATGASRKLAAPFALLGIGGLSLFFASWFADVYGTARGAATGEDVPTGAPQKVLPAVESSAGYRYVYDPAFAYRSFFVSTLDARYGRLRVRPEGWFGMGHANERLRVLTAWRLAGARALSFDGRTEPRPSRDGSMLDVEVAGTRHAFGPERFTMTSLELGLAGRLDLRRLARPLAGSFAEAGAGVALARHDYAIDHASTDFTEILLARTAFGVYLGKPHDRPFGEVSLTYDHRHDGLAAGLKMAGLGSGVAGSFGLRGLAYLTSEIGALAEVQVGSAWVGGVSILVRQAVLP